MKYKIFLFLFSVLIFVFLPLGSNMTQAINQTESDLLLRYVEILRQEVFNLQTLLSNSQLRQKINAPSYLAISLTDNSVILNKNPDQPHPIASITKLMSAVITLENIDTKKSITLTEEMLKPLGSSQAFVPGLNIIAEDLLRASLIQSSNDATEVLAISLGKEKFLSLMNEKAKELKMANTVFYDAHGLNPNNHSTVTDLAKLLAYIYKNHPEILSITRSNNLWLPDQGGKLLKFINLNGFYPLSEFIGGKSGYLVEAKQTLASIFNIKGKPVAIIMLYSKNYQADIFAILRDLKN